MCLSNWLSPLRLREQGISDIRNNSPPKKNKTKQKQKQKQKQNKTKQKQKQKNKNKKQKTKTKQKPLHGTLLNRECTVW